MIVNVEFFDENPIENVVTSLHYRVDKTVFFGYANMVTDHQKYTERFLKEICGVREVKFCVVDNFDLTDIMNTISRVVRQDIREGHKVFFDLTGGESLPLVAFGILSRELSAPMHTYDVHSGQLHEYGYAGSALLSKTAQYDPIELNLDSFISLYGGTINYRMHKDFKDTRRTEDMTDVVNMWNLSRQYGENWVHYSALLRKFVPDEQLTVHTGAQKMSEQFRKLPVTGGMETFHRFLDDCQSLGFLEQVRHENGVYHYRYKNPSIKNYFWDGGSILEMYAFLKEARESGANDCRIGVHIDWDGVIHNSAGKDVLNEIDIMSVKDNLPTFISCKIGNVDQRALYELEAIANRFGGKYARKVLVIAKDMAPGHILRAREMGIEVRKIDSISTQELA